MAVLLLLYLVFALGYAVVLLQVDETVARVMGVALLVLPLLGAWALTAEIVFGVRAERLNARLEQEGLLPEDEVPLLPSGRPDRVAAGDLFPAYRADVERDPESWRAWLRLAYAYDAAGDRRRARWATRSAISRSREQN
jgi:hypothetical protein